MLKKRLLEELEKTNKKFVVIDRNADALSKLSDTILYVHGDATTDVILLQAGIRRAKGIFCTLPTDAENLLLTLTAKGLNPDVRVITKAVEEESEEKLRRAGADGVVIPDFIGGLRMASEMIRPSVVSFLDEMLREKTRTIRVEDIPITESSPYLNKTIKESGLLERDNLTVVAIKDGKDYIFTPQNDFVLRQGNGVIVIGDVTAIMGAKDMG